MKKYTIGFIKIKHKELIDKFIEKQYVYRFNQNERFLKFLKNYPNFKFFILEIDGVGLAFGYFIREYNEKSKIRKAFLIKLRNVSHGQCLTHVYTECDVTQLSQNWKQFLSSRQAILTFSEYFSIDEKSKLYSLFNIGETVSFGDTTTNVKYFDNDYIVFVNSKKKYKFINFICRHDLTFDSQQKNYEYHMIMNKLNINNFYLCGSSTHIYMPHSIKLLKDINNNKKLIKFDAEFKEQEKCIVKLYFDFDNNEYYIKQSEFKRCFNFFKMTTTQIELDSLDLSFVKGFSNEMIKYIIDCNPFLPLGNEKKYNLDSVKRCTKIAWAYLDGNLDFNPYQYLPWLFFYSLNENNILISDEVGLGKTIEAGILIKEELHLNSNRRIVIVCPTFLRNKWKDDLKEKLYLDSSIFGETMGIEETAITIVPLTRIDNFISCHSNTKIDMLIVDEIHYFKNNLSHRFAALKKLILVMMPGKKVFMSATPINNKTEDIFSIIELFGEKYVKTNTTKKQAYIHIPNRRIHEINVDLSDEEIRLYKTTDLLDPFGGTIYRHIGASCLNVLKKYALKDNAISDGMIEEFEIDNYDIGSTQRFKALLETIPSIKNDSKLECLKDFLNDLPNNQIIVFSHYIETIKYLYNQLKELYYVGFIYGNEVSEETIPVTDKSNKFKDAQKWIFNAKCDSKTILICSDSCKEGIDLQCASCLINYDLPFNPAILEQRIGRVDRKGQLNIIDVYNFHVNQTYDDRLRLILEMKLRLINSYARKGIGNSLEIEHTMESCIDRFVRYFQNNIDIQMSVEDFSIVEQILKEFNIPYKNTGSGTELLQILDANKKLIASGLSEEKLQEFTDEQLVEQRERLKTILNFPAQEACVLTMDNTSKSNILKEIKKNVMFRSRISRLIHDYDFKFLKMEYNGVPMNIKKEDIVNEIIVSTNKNDIDIYLSKSIVDKLQTLGVEVI